MGHPTERENAQEPSTSDEVSTPEQPTDVVPPESTAPGAPDESVEVAPAESAAPAEAGAGRTDGVDDAGTAVDVAPSEHVPGPAEEPAPAAAPPAETV
ncbi:hypothetical protein DLJ96_05980, partial [Actinotalea fermentans ATCC 43279 = JCM 9966 = DSM 3133]